MPTNSATVEPRRAAAEEALERELRRIVDSGEYGEWFRRMSLFRRYAPANSLWIMAQLAARPDAAGVVASYRTWQQLGRQVRKGERGIMVWYPRPYWVDPATGDRVRPPRSEGDRARLQRRVSFGVGYVFDLSATEGQPLPQLGRPAPDRAPRELADHLDRYCRDHRITVEIRELREGLSGYYQRDGDRVVLDAALSPGERLAILAHELAHREDPELVAAHVAGDGGYYAHNRPDCEAVAEASAHTISARFGHDITGHSAGYIATWIRGDLDRFKQLHERVGQVTRQLVPPDQLDQVLDAARTRATAQASLRTTTGRSR
ncbi:MAG: ArdC-like ssDNA-binding domain-containing protein [Actinomycetota bacterium]|nr:ArdC-like ssDNA-binding domain-containing protein [Actinomycetota bacterium]